MVTLSNNIGQKVKVPATIFEWSTELFQRVIKDWDGKDRVKLFSIFTGWDYALLMKSKSEEVDEMIMKVTAHAMKYEVDLESLHVPESIKIKGQTIKLPKKLEAMTIAQNMHVRNAMQTCKDLRELISYTCAIYLQPCIDGEFEYDSALVFEEEIKLKPIIETYPIGFFLLLRLKKCGKSGWPDLLRLIRLNRWNVNISLVWLWLIDLNPLEI